MTKSTVHQQQVSNQAPRSVGVKLHARSSVQVEKASSVSDAALEGITNLDRNQIRQAFLEQTKRNAKT